MFVFVPMLAAVYMLKIGFFMVLLSCDFSH